MVLAGGPGTRLAQDSNGPVSVAGRRVVFQKRPPGETLFSRKHPCQYNDNEVPCFERRFRRGQNMKLFEKMRRQKLLSTTLMLFTLSLGIVIGTLLNTGVHAQRGQAA